MRGEVQVEQLHQLPIAERAVAEGVRPILAGRSDEKLRPVAERLGCPFRSFGLDDRKRLDEGLDRVDIVLHCAGPFSSTAEPMVEATPCAETDASRRFRRRGRP